MRRCPGLQDSLAALQQQQRREGTLPSAFIQQYGISRVQLGPTLESFEEMVVGAPSLWCDGTGTREARMLLCASVAQLCHKPLNHKQPELCRRH